MSCTHTAAGLHRPRHSTPIVGLETRARASVLRSIWRTLMRWHERARQRQDLAELDKRMLRDVGLTPDQVAREVKKPFWVE